MRYCQHFRYLAVFLVLALVNAGWAHTQDKGDFIRTVQGAYYSLPKKGITELQCSVEPDWAAVLRQEMKTDVKPDNAGLKLLNGVRFWVSVSETGKAKLTHQVDRYPQSPPNMDDLQKAIGGVEETVDGFWRTASVFLFTSALPKPETAYQLSEQEGSYLLSYRDGGYDIVTILAKDYAISEVKVSSATLSSSLKPRFTKTKAGFLPTAYDAAYKQGAADPAHVSVQITYQTWRAFNCLRTWSFKPQAKAQSTICGFILQTTKSNDASVLRAYVPSCHEALAIWREIHAGQSNEPSRLA